MKHSLMNFFLQRSRDQRRQFDQDVSQSRRPHGIKDNGDTLYSNKADGDFHKKMPHGRCSWANNTDRVAIWYQSYVKRVTL